MILFAIIIGYIIITLVDCPAACYFYYEIFKLDNATKKEYKEKIIPFIIMCALPIKLIILLFMVPYIIYKSIKKHIETLPDYHKYEDNLFDEAMRDLNKKYPGVKN